MFIICTNPGTVPAEVSKASCKVKNLRLSPKIKSKLYDTNKLPVTEGSYRGD